MAYLRVKKTGSDSYLYLVKSVWDKKNKTSRQEIIKYLGKAADVAREDIPAEHRGNPKITAALALHNPNNTKALDVLIRKSRQLLYRSLLGGDIKHSEAVFRNYSNMSGTGNFFDRVLKPVMYKIGDDWKAGKISIASEHVASNAAQTLIRGIGIKTNASCKEKLLICVPVGEEHHMGCDMLEVFFSARGFKVFNMGSSIPAETLLRFMDENRPHCVLVSVTLRENLVAGQRLVRKIRRQHDIPVFVGGHALKHGKIPEFNAEIMPDADLEHALRRIKKAVASHAS